MQTSHFTKIHSFSIVHSEQKVKLLVIPGLPDILTLIMIFTKLFFIDYYALFSLSCQGTEVANFSILERFEMK